MAAGSPFFNSLPLEEHGLEWVHPTVPMAHPLDDGTAVVLRRSVDETADGLDLDNKAYRKLMGPLVEKWDIIVDDLLSPFRRPPRHPFAMMRFGLTGMRSAKAVALNRFKGQRARAVFAGLGGHSMLPLERSFTAAFGLVLGIAGHAVGWPFARGGAHSVTLALASHLESLGGKIVTNTPVESIDDLPSNRAILCDITPAQMLKIAGHKLRGGYRRGLEKFRYGVGVFKIDYSLNGPTPWKAPEAALGGTVHVGGTLEAAIWENKHPEEPFVLVAQPSLIDDSRAPDGKHTAWVYSHVPHGTTFDMTDRIEAQIARFAPGFRDLILAKHVMPPLALQHYNANYVAGDSQRRRPGFRPVVHAADVALEPVLHTDEWYVHVLVVHATRRQRPRHVRPPRGALCPAGCLLKQCDREEAMK